MWTQIVLDPSPSIPLLVGGVGERVMTNFENCDENFMRCDEEF